MKSISYIYILHHDASHNKNGTPVLKIGYSYSPKKRGWQLYKGVTGVPLPFSEIYKAGIDKKYAVLFETRVHNRLAKIRLNKHREFFVCEKSEAISIINNEKIKILKEISRSAWYFKMMIYIEKIKLFLKYLANLLFKILVIIVIIAAIAVLSIAIYNNF